MNVKKIKVGHAGTLDPLATGLLILCTGKFTKQISTLQDMEKEYIAVVKLGATTPSYDLETEINQTFPTSHLTKELVEKELGKFVGEQEQLPPVFSAVKLKGKRAYEFARKGEEIVLEKKKIVIHEIELLSYEENEIRIRVSCSKGTYIRSLARDIGEVLGVGGHLSGLERTKIGSYSLDQSMTIEDFQLQMA